MRLASMIIMPMIVDNPCAPGDKSLACQPVPDWLANTTIGILIAALVGAIIWMIYIMTH